MYRDEKDRHLFDDELPYWLAIGPICWNATYRAGYRYVQLDGHRPNVEIRD